MRIFGLRGCSASALGSAVTAGFLHTPVSCSKLDAQIAKKNEEERRRQLDAAIEWSRTNGKKTGYPAVHLTDDDGKKVWPLISEGSVNRRLAGQVDSNNPFHKHQALTPQEERDLVETCKELNLHGQGIKREHLGKLAIDMLNLRPILNVGRDYTPLSANAKRMVERGEPSADWFTRFFAEHSDITEKRAGSEELMRAKWMTPRVSASHFEKLGASMERLGIMVDGKIPDPRRVLNSDECPNPWRGTGDRGKLIAGVGQPCRKLVSAARQHTSLDVLVGLDGWLADPHLILSAVHIQREMIPDKSKVPNSKISASEKGYQTVRPC